MTSIRNYGDLQQKVFQLNTNQRGVVDRIVGKVVAECPPESGRFTVLSAKIVKLISETPCYPFQILIITNKRSRIREYEDRLIYMLGSDWEYIMALTFTDIFKGLICQSKAEFINSNIIYDDVAWRGYLDSYRYLFIDVVGELDILHYLMLEEMMELFSDATVFLPENSQLKIKNSTTVNLCKLGAENFYNSPRKNACNSVYLQNSLNAQTRGNRHRNN